MNNTQWIPFVTIYDGNNSTMRIGNLSNYVIPQFYTLEKDLNGDTKETFYDAIECGPIFKNVEDASLKSELEPLWKGTKWWCPDLKNVILNNDPWTYNIGQNFNFVINFCDRAAETKGQSFDYSNCE